MARVLVVEFDEATRDTLHDMLANAGYEVIETATETDGLAHLAASPESLVALCSNAHVDHHLSAAFFAGVVADQRLAAQHQYLLLSSNPATIPPALQADLSQLNAPVLAKPFDMDTLLATVGAAAARLVPVHPRRRTDA